MRRSVSALSPVCRAAVSSVPGGIARTAPRAARRGARTAAIAAALVVALAGCAAPAPVPSTAPQSETGATAPAEGPASAAPTDASPTPTAVASPTPTSVPVDALTLEQRVGQVFMVGTAVDGASPAAVSAVGDRHVGGIFLQGRTRAGAAAVAHVVAQFTSLASPATTGVTPLWVATDQEGGEVQVIRGPGVEDITYAIRQADLPADELRSRARQWGSELAAAGVNMNLAPIADIVTSHDTRFANPPIGGLGRQYGYDLPTVAEKAGAFAAGMRDAGILPTFKHFPGLGRVSANTDFAADVTDETITPQSPDVGVYGPLTRSGRAAVMVSTAIYDRIDPSQPAAFSPAVLRILREEVGFDGVVITDDLSAAAAAQQWSPADRAIRALAAGADIVLASADPAVLPEMYDAVLAKAQTDSAFAERIDEAAGRVLASKSALP